MLLAVFLKPIEVGEVGMVRASMCEWAARFGTLNSRIPSHSDVAYESRIWGKWHPQTDRSGWGMT